MFILEIIEKVNVLLGIVLNCLLLYLIKRFSRKDIGTYKNLLTCFALYDVFLCTIHGIFNPKIVNVNPIFGAALHSKPLPSILQNRTVSGAFYGCFTIPFALMNLHFLYRYWSIKELTENIVHFEQSSVFSQEKLKWFSEPRRILLLSLYPIAQGAIWLFSARTIGHQFHPDAINRDGHLNVWPFIIILIACGIICPSFCIATTLATLTYRHIIGAKTISLGTRSSQLRILFAVCAQTFVPVFCVYLPYAVVLFAPFFDLPDFGIPKVFPLLVSLFPGWDAVVIMGLMKDYREGLISLVTPAKPKEYWATTQWKTGTSGTKSEAVSNAATV